MTSQTEELLEDAYRVEESSVSPADLLPLYTKINKLFHSDDGFAIVDEFLVEIDVTQTATLVLIGVLRLTYSARHKLPNWGYATECTFAELHNRNLATRPAVLLHGLISDSVKHEQG